MTLEEAIQVVSEGGQALGVTCEDVYKHMLRDERLMLRMLDSIHAWNSFTDFTYEFDKKAEHLLNEALRAKLEDEFGALE